LSGRFLTLVALRFAEDEKKHEMERMLADSDDEAPAPPPPPAAAAALELAAKETRIRLEREKREKAQREMVSLSLSLLQDMAPRQDDGTIAPNPKPPTR
jgi:hypothetical protein